MEYKIALATDIGPEKKSNQDSICVKEAYTPEGTVFFAAVCDGMGGLEKGELASKAMVETFSNWFEEKLPFLLAMPDRKAEICDSLDALIKGLGKTVLVYGSDNHIQLGTTATAALFLPDESYLICHVGDTRVYRIDEDGAALLTEDQTLVQRELRLGRITKEQAKDDPRSNVLLQCVGASKYVQPVYVYGKTMKDACYLLCTDGFRHKISQREIADTLPPETNSNEVIMKRNLQSLINTNIARGETDNISAVLIRVI